MARARRDPAAGRVAPGRRGSLRGVPSTRADRAAGAALANGLPRRQEVAGITDGDIRATSGRGAAVRAHALAHGVTSAHGARIAGRSPGRHDAASTAPSGAACWQRLARDLGIDAARRDRSWAPAGSGLMARRTRGHRPARRRRADRPVPDIHTRRPDRRGRPECRGGRDRCRHPHRAERTAHRHEVRLVDPGRPGRAARYSTEEVLRCEALVLDAAARGRGAAAIARRRRMSPMPSRFRRARCRANRRGRPNMRPPVTIGSRASSAVRGPGRRPHSRRRPVRCGRRYPGHRRRALGPSGARPPAGHGDSERHPARPLRPLGAGRRAAAGCIVVDEASMADSRTLARLVRQAERTGARIVLVGDPHQLPAVGPEACSSRSPSGLAPWSSPRTTARRSHGSARAGTAPPRRRGARLRHGTPTAGSTAMPICWRLRGRVVGCGRRGDPAGSVMLAYRRDEVAALNRAAAARLEAAGRRGPRLGTGDATFAVGDIVRCRINDPRAGLRNGMRGRVVAIDGARAALTVDEDGTRVGITADYRAGGGDRARVGDDRPRRPGHHCRARLRRGTPTGPPCRVGIRRPVAGAHRNPLFVGGDDARPRPARAQPGIARGARPGNRRVAARRREPPAPDPGDGLYPGPGTIRRR